MAKTETKPAKGGKPQLGSQTRSRYYTAVEGSLGQYNPSQITQSTFEKMEADPDIALALSIRKAPIYGIQWDVECEDPDIQRFVENAYEKIHRELARSSLRALARGFIPHEKVWMQVKGLELQRENPDTKQMESKRYDNAYVYEKLKDNYPDSVSIIKKDDIFAGYIQKTNTGDIKVDVEKAFIATWDEQYGNKYGRSILVNAYDPWYQGRKCLLDLAMYLERRGSPALKMRYPLGRSVDDGGTEYDNADTAINMGTSIMTNSVIALPSTQDRESKLYLWDAEYMKDDDKAAQIWSVYNNIYTPAKFRAIFIPEMVAIRSGSSTGTYAQSKTSRTTMIDIQEDLLNWYIQNVNDYILPDLVNYNFGMDAPRAYLTTAGFSDNTKEIYTEIVKGLLQNPEFVRDLDGKAMFEALNVPVKPDGEEEQAPADEENPAVDVKPEPEAETPAPEQKSEEQPPTQTRARCDHEHLAAEFDPSESFKAWREPYEWEKKINYLQIQRDIQKGIEQEFIGGVKKLTDAEKKKLNAVVKQIWKDNPTKAGKIAQIKKLRLNFGKYTDQIKSSLIDTANRGLGEILDEYGIKKVGKLTPAVTDELALKAEKIASKHVALIEEAITNNTLNAVYGGLPVADAVAGINTAVDTFVVGTTEGAKAGRTLYADAAYNTMGAYNSGRNVFADEDFDLPDDVDIVGGVVTNRMDSKVCDFCLAMGGDAEEAVPQFISAKDPDYEALQSCNFHPNCGCMFVYTLSTEKDIETRTFDYKRPDEKTLKDAPAFTDRLGLTKGE